MKPVFHTSDTTPTPHPAEGHSVLVYFNNGIPSLKAVYDLYNTFDALLEARSTGYYDGHELAMDDSHGSLYFYGPNAETLFKRIKPTLESIEFLQGAEATLRFGPVG
ncbi:MAG: hypothetical protein ACFB10_23765 [Salibacteraceae bacterium]